MNCMAPLSFRQLCLIDRGAFPFRTWIAATIAMMTVITSSALLVDVRSTFYGRHPFGSFRTVNLSKPAWGECFSFVFASPSPSPRRRPWIRVPSVLYLHSRFLPTSTEPLGGRHRERAGALLQSIRVDGFHRSSGCYSCGRETRLILRMEIEDNEADDGGKDTSDVDDCDHGASVLRRMNFRGVSVSDVGFLVLLTTRDVTQTEVLHSVGIRDDTAEDGSANKSMVTIPIRVSCDPNDAISASSVEALTIIQLLSGIDMAGPVFPPGVLGHLAALRCEDALGTGDDDGDGRCNDDPGESAAEQIVRSTLRKGLPEGVDYFDASAFQRGKVRLPRVALTSVELSLPRCVRRRSAEEHDDKGKVLTYDGVLEAFVLDDNSDAVRQLPLQYTIQCRIENRHTLEIPLFSEDPPTDCSVISAATEAVVEETAYAYNPASAAFLALGLALRYNAPIVMDGPSLDAIRRRLTLSPSSSSISRSCLISTINTATIGGFLGEEEEEDISAITYALPAWRSSSALRDQSDRVASSLETSFEMGRLESALQIALERGDEAAAERIRKAFGKFGKEPPLPPTMPPSSPTFE